MIQHYDVIIVGAGAAGLFCAFNIAVHGKRVLVLDHANKVGKKILMSGGGRCNFTNLNTTHENFSSKNPHFCKSALNQYSAYQFLDLVDKHNIEYVEKGPGQLFCKNSSKDILQMLLEECAATGVKIYKKCTIDTIKVDEVQKFLINSSCGDFFSESLVVATGGLSIPTLGATGFGYTLAEQFGHKIIPTSASLVPFILAKKNLSKIKDLAGVALPASITLQSAKNTIKIDDDLLFTHRGLSGPVVLRISTDWKPGNEININLLPDIEIEDYIKEQCIEHGERLVINSLGKVLPKRVASFICSDGLRDKKIKQLDKQDLQTLKEKVNHWRIRPEATEGYKTAEVTLGGISTDEISSKTFESRLQKNLYFIGEVLDVTGELGGYNFQWAWSSAWCAAQSLKEN